MAANISIGINHESQGGGLNDKTCVRMRTIGADGNPQNWSFDSDEAIQLGQLLILNALYLKALKDGK